MLSLVYLQTQENAKDQTLLQPHGGEKGLCGWEGLWERFKSLGQLKEAGPFLTWLMKHVYLASTKTGYDHWILHFKLVNPTSIKV